MRDTCCGSAPDVGRLQADQRRVLKIVLAVNALTFAMMLASSLASGSMSLLSGGLDNFGDALTYGLSLAVGVIVRAAVITFTGWTAVDPIIAALIGLWVLPRTWTLLREAGHVLMQGVPQGVDMAALRTALEEVPGVAQIQDVRV